MCLLHFAHEAAGAPGARHSLRPLIFGADVEDKTRVEARRDREGVCGVGCLNPLSSPAKAGDPVFQKRARFIERSRRTGYPAFAEYDDHLCDKHRMVETKRG